MLGAHPRAGLLIKEKSLKKAKAMVLHFIAQEDPAFGRSSIKQKASSSSEPQEFELPTLSGAPLLSICQKHPCELRLSAL
jgi:hypothetical protein